MGGTVFGCSWDNKKQHNGRKKIYLAGLQGKNYKFEAGYVGMKIRSRDREGGERR